MKDTIDIFIVHGHDNSLRDDLELFLKRKRNLNVNPIILEKFSRPGDIIIQKLESLALNADAAFILATPDDMGGVIKSKKKQPRARQNVWLELGWFLARLGIERTFLIIKGDVEVPSDYAGIIYAHISNDFAEIKPKLNDFLGSIRTLPPGRLTELEFLSSNTLLRDRDWNEIHESAQSHLLITGISFGRLKDYLGDLMKKVINKPDDFVLEFLITNPEYIVSNYGFFHDNHGRNTLRDNIEFILELIKLLLENENFRTKVKMHLHNGLLTFACVAGDKNRWKGTMITQFFIKDARQKGYEYPRFKLRNRTSKGVFSTFSSSVDDLIADSNTNSINTTTIELEKLQKTIKSLTGAKNP